MKKSVISLLFCFLLLSMMILPVRAASGPVQDYAGLLNSTEIQVLSEWCAELQSEQSLDVVLLVVPNLMGKSAQSFADDFYDNNRYGPDGVLFLLDTGSRQWHISTAGKANEALSGRDLEEIGKKVIPYFSENRFYDGFCRFLDILPDYLAVESLGGVNPGISVLTGAAIAGISVLVMVSTMNSSRKQRSAAVYEKEGSFHLSRHQDLFLYSNVSKRAKPRNNTSGSIHRSASGRSHGGRGGRF